LLLFPFLSVAALFKLVAVAQAAPFTVDSFSQGLGWFGVFVLGVAMSHHILTIEFALPNGVGLPVSRAPKLLARIETPKEAGFWRNLFWPKFSNVLLSEKFELEIRKTPVIGVPVWSKNTLVIGLPVMQTIPEHYFGCVLERKLIQYSKGRNILTNWLCQLRGVWSIYPDAFSQRGLLGEQLIAFFFKLYAPFYGQLSLCAAQQEELAADTVALREINDSDLFKAIQSQTVGHYFFHHVYVPKVTSYIEVKHVNPAQLAPYSKLPGAFRRTVDIDRFRQWIEACQHSGVESDPAAPTFAQRMHNMGQTKIRLPKLGQPSAAESYFDAHYAKVAQHMDSIWGNKVQQRMGRREKPPVPISGPKVRMGAFAD
jgi:hypothetical protein